MPPVQPYHYGSHYSNSGTVLHFLVRMPPFTKMFLAYQGEFLGAAACGPASQTRAAPSAPDRSSQSFFHLLLV